MTHCLLAIVVEAKGVQEAEKFATGIMESMVGEHWGFFDYFQILPSNDSRWGSEFKTVRADTKQAKKLLDRLFETNKENQLFYLKRLRTILALHTDEELANFKNVDSCTKHTTSEDHCDDWRFYAGELGVNTTYHVFDGDGEQLTTYEDFKSRIDDGQYFVVPVDAHH